jgi:putative restriction endonuclease
MLTDLLDAEKEQASHEKKALALFDNDASVSETRVKRIARPKAFSKRLAMLYGNKWCVCGAAMKSHAGRYETEGAHVVSRNLKGADDARNGLLLCRSHH